MRHLDIEPEPAAVDVLDAIVEEAPSDMARGPMLSPVEHETALARRSTELDEQAAALLITDAASFVRAGHFLETVSALTREIEAFFKDDIERAHATWKGLTSKRARYVAPLERAAAIVSDRYTTFEREDKARAEAKRRERELAAQKQEQERLRAEAEAREAEAAELAAAALSATSRDEALILSERAEEALVAAQEIKVEAAAVEAPVLPLIREAPDVGPKVRANWTFEVVDKDKLVKAVAAGQVSLEAVEPNETYLRKRAQADKSTCQIPGVRVWDAGTVIKRRTPPRSQP